MSDLDIVRAWKDEDYRLSLSEAERAQLPENPAGMIELSDTDLSEVNGGTTATGDVCCLTISISVAVSLAWCSPSGTFCGTCNWGTHGCC